MGVSACFGCRKCTAGCPLAFAMDIPPDGLVRLVQLGARDEALRSATIWVCASCQTCAARCPNGVDLPALMDTLKQMALAAGFLEPPASERGSALMQRLFLEEVRRRGRIHELSLMARYKLRAGGLWDDLALGWRMAVRGRLRLLPPRRLKGVAEVRRLFAGAGGP